MPAAALVLAFLGATTLTDRLRRPWAAAPLGLLCAALVAVFHELARWSHGQDGFFFGVGWIGAPVAAILGGASWGTRRFYGWPDLGPHPSRLALAASAVLLGVLLGTHRWPEDVARTQARGEELRRGLLAWREAHGGRWPERLEEAVPAPGPTRLGAWDPPPFELRASAGGRAVLAFPISARRAFELDLEGGGWAQAARRGAGDGR